MKGGNARRRCALDSSRRWAVQSERGRLPRRIFWVFRLIPLWMFLVSQRVHKLHDSSLGYFLPRVFRQIDLRPSFSLDLSCLNLDYEYILREHIRMESWELPGHTATRFERNSDRQWAPMTCAVTLISNFKRSIKIFALFVHQIRHDRSYRVSNI